MNLLFEDKDRRIVPRWRDSLTTISAGELSPIEALRAVSEPREDFLAAKIKDWESHRTVSFAADLMGAALVLNRTEEARAAAEYVICNDSGATVPAQQLARRLLGLKDVAPEDQRLVNGLTNLQSSRMWVHQLRRRLEGEPRNALMWVDLARHYAILGLGKRAARSMDAALRLVPNNRFVLRSAARLYVHINDPERAHDLILRSASSKQDPWLIAAELATAAVADRTPRLVRSGRGIMASGGFPDSQISELASALATLELSSGNSRIARRLFREALLDPTDNTVAQAKWASSRLNDLGLEEKHFALPLSFEARAQEYYSVGSSIEALDECRKWFDDEPYSSRPPLFGSFVSAVILEDYLTSTEFAEVGLSANPNDPLLTNNLVFALASNGKTQNAQEIYDRMNEERFDDDVKIVWLATGGLLAFRKGDLASGRALYQKAIERASDSGKIDLRAMAAAFLAREELIAQTPLALRALEFASTAAEGSTNVALRIILLRLRSMQA